MDIFEYIEMFYNVKRRHGSNNQLSPVEYEKQYERRLTSVYWLGGYSSLLIVITYSLIAKLS